MLDDGAETDLDSAIMNGYPLDDAPTISPAGAYQTVLEKERRGDYLGKTVQVIPHVTDDWQRVRRSAKCGADVVITEIGGTTGDIEGLPFLEASREASNAGAQFHFCACHLRALHPRRRRAGQAYAAIRCQAARDRHSTGYSGRRTEKPIDQDMRQKISLFCNVPVDGVIEEIDVEHSIYEVPLMLQREKMDELL